MITGKFTIKDNNILTTYARYDDIPAVFDHLIEFIPDFPPGPHTDEEHDDMGEFNLYLLELLKRERHASRSKKG